MKVFLFTFAFILTVAISLSGQNISHSEIKHYFGYSLSFSQIKEENLIPKVNSGISHFLSYGFEKVNKVYHRFDFNLGYGKLKTDIEEEALSFNAQLLLSYCHDFEIFKNDWMVYYLGPTSSFTSSLSEYENWDEAHAYWGNYFSFGPSNTIVFSLQEDKLLAMRLDLSIVGFYTRPDYDRLYANEYWTFSNIIKIMNSNYHFGLWNNAFQLKGSFEDRIPIFTDRNLSLSYSVYYSRIQAKDGKPLTELFHKLGVGIWL